MKKIKAISYWDTEDWISLPEAGSDDIIKFIADECSKLNFKTCFHITGDKLRSLCGRKRKDVIDSMKRHEVSLHYNYGSVHPTTTELLTDCAWDDGVSIALNRETPGFRFIENIFGRCPAMSTHGGQYAPQIAKMCALEKKIYWLPYVCLPGYEAFWFCGALCLGNCDNHGNKVINGKVIRPRRFFNTDGKLTDADFEQYLANEICRDIMDLPENTDYIWFGGHPHRIICKEFSCKNFRNSQNRLLEHLSPPEPLSGNKKKIAMYNLHRFLELISRHQSLQIMTLSEFAASFMKRRWTVNEDELLTYAAKIVKTKTIHCGKFFSAADGLTALAEAVLTSYSLGKVSYPLRLHNIEGPKYMPVLNNVPKITVAELLSAARSFLRIISGSNSLPHGIMLASGKELGLGTLLIALSKVFLEKIAINKHISLYSTEPWPDFAENMDESIETMRNWTVFSKDINLEKIKIFSKFMSWTMCPAES